MTLANILKKASEHASAASFPAANLIDDMQPLSFQVETASILTKNVIGYLNGIEVERPRNSEKSLEDLIALCEETIAYLGGINAEQVEGKDLVQVELSLGKAGTKQLSGKDYVLAFALPNFFFHLQTAYAILRMKGVPLGKADYLGPFMMMED